MDPILEVRGLSKHYGGLRPLRVASLAVAPGERVAILGLDAQTAEVLVNLLTGATLPGQGEVRLFGRATSAITGSGDWLATLDRLGLVSPRAILPDAFTVRQAIALALTLSLDPVPGEVSTVVERLAGEAGLAAAALDELVQRADHVTRARCRLARALATDPALLLLEHANALVPGDATRFGAEIGALAAARGLAVVAMTADAGFARAVAGRVLQLDGATGRLRETTGWRGWFGR